jgi:TRAP-type C4-dicarboxylate transport system substrate-binding protein
LSRGAGRKIGIAKRQPCGLRRITCADSLLDFQMACDASTKALQSASKHQLPKHHSLSNGRIITVLAATLIFRSLINFLVKASATTTIAAVVTALSLGNAFAHGVTLKAHHALPTDSTVLKNFLEPWVRTIHDESGARINFLMSADDPADGAYARLLQMAKDRQVDVVWLDLHNAAKDFPKFSVFGLPLATNSSEGSSRALWAYVDNNDLGFREFGKLRVIAASRHGAPLFHMRSMNIESLSDLNGSKIAIPNPDSAALLTAVGASPMITPESSIGEALSGGKVDGALLSWSRLAALKLEELVKTHTGFPAGAPSPYAETSVLLMNRDAYRSLADDLKRVVGGYSGSDASAWIGAVFDEGAAGARQRARERGDAINILPADDLARWQDAVKAVVDARIRNLDERGLNGKSLINEARELITEYDPVK